MPEEPSSLQSEEIDDELQNAGVQKKPEVRTYKMKLEKCHKCIVQNPVVDPNNEDDYIRRELNGKAVFFHGICYKTWIKEQEQTD